MNIAIYANPVKDKEYRCTQSAAELLAAQGFSLRMEQEVAEATGFCSSAVPHQELCKSADALVVLGGDGTLLMAARMAVREDVPMLGINLGRRGFLTELEIGDMRTGFERLAQRKYQVEERMMVRADIYDADGTLCDSDIALNEFYVSGREMARMINLQASIGDVIAGVYAADGMIISTPTGSTGYSLAARGPVVIPQMECLIMTPVCAHLLTATPLVISSEEKVSIRVVEPSTCACLYGDGSSAKEIPVGGRVTIVKDNDNKAKFIRFGGRNFYTILREKLSEKKL